MSPMPTSDIMSLDQALEQLFSTLQGMEAFVNAALAQETETLEDEINQQPAHLIKLFLTPLRAAYSAILEHQS